VAAVSVALFPVAVSEASRCFAAAVAASEPAGSLPSTRTGLPERPLYLLTLFVGLLSYL
jgi:hypothetical protein